MITLLLGTDTLAKKLRISEAAKLAGAEVETFTESTANLSVDSILQTAVGQQLFGAPKIVVLDHVWKKLDTEVLLEKFGDSSASFYIVEDSLDKRTSANKEFLKDARVTVVELNAPIGTRASTDWIVQYAKDNNIKIDSAAAFALASALLLDEDASLDVLHAQNELQKLKQFAVSEGGAITKDMVALLVETETGVDVFALLNAIATKNKKLALQMLTAFFETETADEKTNAIKVAALLSDQFRSLAIAIDADERRMPDDAVLQLTGWKSGRLFIMKKLSRNFTLSKVKQALSKLENLDRELKTGTMPPHVVLDLIIADM
ncbi:MAG TPA: hypothetical protein VHQ41_03870 [Patescibacteria group bacterium]|jgi:DNA polymerase-3 subunit delta|nr:hypothetical protein [Patescibacteria group bacterium]